jgi:hypothetical protein
LKFIITKLNSLHSSSMLPQLLDILFHIDLMKQTSLPSVKKCKQKLKHIKNLPKVTQLWKPAARTRTPVLWPLSLNHNLKWLALAVMPTVFYLISHTALFLKKRTIQEVVINLTANVQLKIKNYAPLCSTSKPGRLCR